MSVLDIFGERLAKARKKKGISQASLAKLLETSTSVIGRYERGKMAPSIEVVHNIANLLETSVSYLIGETDFSNDSLMLKRLNEFHQFSEEDKEHILYTLDALIRNVKTRDTYS